MISLVLNLEKPKSPKDFVWENRILIISSSKVESFWFEQNLQKNLNDRKLLVFYFKGDFLVKTTFQGKVDAGKFLEKLPSKISNPDRWVLIGLDGGVKFMSSKSPLPSEIFRIIDAMPMRQSEIRSTEN
ncbi:DUF4174 domain-containing protein [Algoriphagus sp.]|uniref:DUF4174 domain-containing protein n=1 Tax=Algoriphagus sp. TaxID=1872435 RepID=UPI0039197F6E